MNVRESVRRVLVLHATPDDFRADLAGRFPGVEFDYATRPEEVEPALERARPDAVLSIAQVAFRGASHRPALLHPGVRWLHVGGSGYDHILPLEPAAATVTNSAGVLAPFLAETVTGAILALNGHFLAYVEQAKARLWRPRPFRPLAGQTLLVVGLGAIGGCVAANAKALGMRVIATRRRREPHPDVDTLHPPEALAAIIAEADFVSLHVRADASTRHMMDAGMFAAMRPGAMFLNTSRGSVVNEAALIEALESGRLGGAYLDVFETEPLPAASPLWSLPNVIVTPHSSDTVADWAIRFARHFGDNLERWNAGRPLLNVVKP